MKLKQIVVVTATAVAACAAGSASAFIHPASIPAGAVEIYLGGATAQDKGIALLMRRICKVDTMTVVTGDKNTAYMCLANGAETNVAPFNTPPNNITDGTPLVLYKNSKTGSGSGVNPVANNTTIPFVILSSLTAAEYGNADATTAGTKCTTSIAASTVDFANFAQYVCGTNISLTTTQVPDAGISDVEPPLLGYAPNVVNGVTINQIIVKPGPQLIFGVPVSMNFYRALQTAQGKDITSNSEANMPSLTKAQIAAIMTGGITTVPTLSDNLGVKLTSPAGSAAFTFCRRANGSGTLAATQAYFTGEGCSKYPVKPMLAVGGATPNGDVSAPNLPSNRIAEYGGTTGIVGCLNKAASVNKYAIGMLTTEVVPGKAYGVPGPDAIWGSDDPLVANTLPKPPGGQWGWVKIGGYAGTNVNTVQTKYDNLAEATYQYRVGGNIGVILAGTKKTLMDIIIDANSKPLVIKELNLQFIQPYGQAGLLGVPSATNIGTLPSAGTGVLTTAEVTANPINTWTHAALGAPPTPNACQPASIFNGRETGLDMLQ